MAEDQLLYTTRVHNDEGLKGTAWVEGPYGLKVETSSPLKTDEPGTNPEQLMALSWATCLNATIEIALKGRGQNDVKSEVVIEVNYKKNLETTITYFAFDVDVYVALPQAEAEALVAASEKRCPVSQILENYPHKTVRVHGQK
ncbi:OsmC family peroxiredoxin [Aerococcus agrisoli]|uniref:OsmC family peroxiredoxin n=1 Tax=Aerococcus agrisoli TaxID=2487350 RepID=A0A3N4G513_9LACT|nr:OsmC family protein [Aerococcus agrisoli]RPA57972.1 OsmC family peroxiredoxin [Aerococcus agrisoli]